MSPTSVAITFEQIKRGSELSISEVFKMEYRLGNHIKKISRKFRHFDNKTLSICRKFDFKTFLDNKVYRVGVIQ